MFKILIVEKNIMQCKYLITYLNNIDINFKVYGIAYTLNEIFELLLTENFDLILLDANISDTIYNEFFNFLKSKELIKYKNSVILIIDNNKNINNVSSNFYINNYFFKPLNKDTFSKTIMHFFIEKNKDMIINRIKFELQKLHFKSSYKGTQCLISCIYQSLILNNKLDFSLFTDIFPIVAKEYGKSVDCIYGSIKSTIKNMFYDCDEETLKDYLNYYDIISPPKPKEIICQILENINI